MADTCPSCGIADTLSPALGQQLCSRCGYISQEVDLQEHTQGSTGGVASRLPSHLRTGAVSREQSRKVESFRRKPEVVARIKLALQRLERPSLFEQVDFLFDHARSESWRLSDQLSAGVAATVPLDCHSSSIQRLKRPVQWGEPSFSLAAACCFAVLRREGHLVDVTTVAHAADLPVLRVKAAVRRLSRLVALQLSDVQLSNPDASIQHFLRYFVELANTKDAHPTIRKFLQPLLTKRMANINIERTALDLCSFWWPRRPVLACDPRLAAFVLVVVALEAHAKAAAPRHHIFLLFLQADRREEHASHHEAANARSRHALWARHREILAALDKAAQQFPWLMTRSAGNKALRFSHLELLANLADLLQIDKTSAPEISAQQAGQASKLGSLCPDPLTQPLHNLQKQQTGHEQAAGFLHTVPETGSEQDGASLDLLSDDELDALLFTADELQSIFRTSQSERDALLEAKVVAGIWDREDAADATQAATRARAHSDRSRPDPSAQQQSKRRKLTTSAQAELLPSVPLDEQQAESDWSDNDR